MLMDAAVFDDHDVPRLPLDPLAVVNVMASALEHVEYGTVQVAVLLSVGSGCVDLDMRLNRLRHRGRLRADNVFAEQLRAALPRKGAGTMSMTAVASIGRPAT